jgi:hypothetical protein
MLLPGSYHVAAAVMGHPSGHVYDHSPNIVEFDVVPTPGSPDESGCMSLDGTWLLGSPTS